MTFQWEIVNTGWTRFDLQAGREISAINVIDDYLCYKESKRPYNFFSYFNI